MLNALRAARPISFGAADPSEPEANLTFGGRRRYRHIRQRGQLQIDAVVLGVERCPHPRWRTRHRQIGWW